MKATRAGATPLKLVLGTVLAAMLGACATPPQYSRTDDPFKALAAKSQRSHAAAKICLLLSENTGKAVAHLGEMHALGATWGANAADVDPKQRVAELTEVLTSRFRETVRVHALDQVQTHNCDLTLALDIQIKLGQASFSEHTVDISGTLVDARNAPLDKLSAAGKSTVPFPAFNLNFLPAWNQAIGGLGDRLDQSRAVAAYVAALPQPTGAGPQPAAATVAPASIDLAFWDSIKSSANPADFQAYLRKFPTGAFESLARSRLATLGEAAPVRLTPLAQPAGKQNFGNYHALVIGIDRYRTVTPLKTAVSDARTVAELLQKEYGFKVTLLLDATRNQMLDSFDDLRRTLTDADNLLIYYAGHGHLDADSDRGFWLPVDADANRRANWLSNSDIADVVRGTRAKHVLVVADSCYAGTLTRSLAVQMTALDDFARLSQKRARTALVSGGLEPVEDAGGGGKHSVFAKAFIDALRANTGIVDMSQIFSAMRRQVVLSAQQTPQYSDIRQVGHEGGDFIFVRRK